MFQRDFNDTELEAAFADFWPERNANATSRHFCESLVRGVERYRQEIDERLRKYAEHWSLERMGAVDRNIPDRGIWKRGIVVLEFGVSI